MKILAFVLAGGKGTRLHPLTATHAKPALPFANDYRIIDFVLSNLFNSGIPSVYVLAQYRPHSLIEHLDAAWAPHFAGRDRLLSVVLPQTGGGDGAYAGTAHAVYQNLDLIARHRPDLVAVFAADHVYRMDVRQMADFHRQCDAEVTVAAVPVPIENASAFGVIATTDGGRVCKFEEKPAQPEAMPEDPARAYASMGNYLFDPGVLARVLEEVHRDGGSDFGRHVMPHVAGRSRTFAYDFSCNVVPGLAPYEESGYWRDVGTPEALFQSQRDVREPQPRLDLNNRQWPLRGGGWQSRVPRKIAGGFRRDRLGTAQGSSGEAAAFPVEDVVTRAHRAHE